MTKLSSPPPHEHPLDKFPGEPGYDTSRVHAAGITWFIVGLLVGLAAIFVGLWYFELHLEKQPAPAAAPKPLPSHAQPLQPSPNHPLLPWEDLAALRQSQEHQLHTAGPNHIPIDQAIDKLLDSGALNQPWQNPTTQPYTRPPNEPPTTPSVENRT